jgi:hypothetical protein
MQSYLGRMISTAWPRFSSSRLRPKTTSPNPPACATGAHSEATITMNTAVPPRATSASRPSSDRRLSQPVALAGKATHSSRPAHAGPMSARVCCGRSEKDPACGHAGSRISTDCGGSVSESAYGRPCAPGAVAVTWPRFPRSGHRSIRAIPPLAETLVRPGHPPECGASPRTRRDHRRRLGPGV